MVKTFVVADTHFGHTNICKFTREDGTPLRPWDDPEKMNDDMIKLWNETVEDKDRVYILGDFVMNRRYLWIAGQLKGRKVLVKGNHDIFKLKDYLPYFDDIRAYVVKPKLGIIMSHVPIHPDSIKRYWVNIHGHTHARNVKLGEFSNDQRYMCVSVEQTDYKPVDLDKIIKILGRHEQNKRTYKS